MQDQLGELAKMLELNHQQNDYWFGFRMALWNLKNKITLIII